MKIEIDLHEVLEETGYSESKVRKDLQRGKLDGLRLVVAYVFRGYLDAGVEKLATVLGQMSQDDMEKKSGAPREELSEACDPLRILGVERGVVVAHEPPSVDADEVAEWSAFEVECIRRFMGKPWLMTQAGAEGQIRTARAFICADHIEDGHMDELGW